MRSGLTWTAVAVVTGAAVLAMWQATAPAQNAGGVALTTPQARTSYSLGYTVGKSIRDQGVQTDEAVFLQGIRDGLRGAKPAMSDAQMTATLKAFRRDMLMRQKERAERLAAENLKKGQAFRTSHAKEPGVKVTASGLQYKVLRAGTGKSPGASDIVTVHYRGTLIDGTEIETTYTRGQPALLALSGALPGWTEGLQLMKEGAKVRFVLPPDLAFGKRGTADVPPNATVIYEFELLKIR